LLFQGEEWAASAPFPYFADHRPELADAVRAGRLAEFPGHLSADVADPGAVATYESARLQWTEPTSGTHARVMAWYQGLLRLRRTRSDLGAGGSARHRHPNDAPGVMLVERGSLLVACNLGPVPWTVEAWPDWSGDVRPLLAWREDGDIRRLEPGNAAVFELTSRVVPG
jgi:maltooligosyltrehalose trehalohydrolase